jgi:hypothetical protein
MKKLPVLPNNSPPFTNSEYQTFKIPRRQSKKWLDLEDKARNMKNSAVSITLFFDN